MPSLKRRIISKDSSKELRIQKAGPENSNKIHGNTSRDHIQRIYVILAELQNQRFPNGEQLARLCGVSTKTIKRDLQSMELLMGVEIPFDPLKRGYSIIGEVQHFPMLKLEVRDLLMLHFLRQCLAPYDGTEIGKSMIESFNRAFGLLTGTTNWKNWEDAVWFRFEGRPEIARGDGDLFDLFYRAIRSREKVTFDYHSPSKKKTERRTVEPLFIFMRNGRWFLHATNEGKEEKRTFVFARISKAVITGEQFLPREITPAQSFHYSFGVVAGELPPKENVVLDFAPEVTMRVMETLWHPEQKISKLRSGGVRLTLPIAEDSYMELKPWLLGWGATVKVIGPKSLADDLHLIVDEMFQQLQ